MSVAYKTFSYDSDKGNWTVFASLCKGCGLCKEKCPKNCLSWSAKLGIYGTPSIEPNMDECIVCGICQIACPDCAIAVTKKK